MPYKRIKVKPEFLLLEVRPVRPGQVQQTDAAAWDCRSVTRPRVVSPNWQLVSLSMSDFPYFIRPVQPEDVVSFRLLKKSAQKG
jgi:hypothetical protein